MNTDVQPSEVLETDPDGDVIDELEEADIVPTGAGANQRPASDRNQEMLEVLRDIRDLLDNGGSA